jgi:hypothetical protein
MQLSDNQWKKIESINKKNDCNSYLKNKIEQFHNIFNVDYNLHFGKQIEFSANSHLDAENACLEIEKIIGNYKN